MMLAGVFSQAIDWLSDPVNWSWSEGGQIPHRIAQHLAYSGIAVAIACLVAVPAGMLIGHTRRAEFVVVSVANLGRAIPSFAVLSIVYQLMLAYTATQAIAFGPGPIVVAMFLLSVPPILTNTYVGIQQVDPDTVEAARGMGMTGGQIVRRLELPLAAPLIVVGIRTAAVQVIATVTLAALIAGGGLGRPIVDGLATQDPGQYVGGAILVSALAIVAEVLFGGVARLAAPRTASRSDGRVSAGSLGGTGSRGPARVARRRPGTDLGPDGHEGGVPMRTSRTVVLGATVLALALLAGACASGGDDTGGQPSVSASGSAPAEKGDLIVGVSGAFPENQLVAEMYAQVLEDAGYTVERQLDLRTRQLSDQALFSGEIDIKPEYLGFELPELDPDADTTGSAEEIAGMLGPLLEAEGVKLLDFSPANSTNAFVVTPETAESLGVATVSDLAPIAGDLTLGGAPECPENALCIPGLKEAYGIEFGDFKPLDVGGPQTVAAIEAGAVDVGLLFSLDPVIEDKGWVVLADDEELQAAGNFAAVIREDVTNEEIEGLLNGVTASLTDEGLRTLIARVAIDKEDVADVAAEYLQDQGLL